jgi:hypothetical protein
MHGSKRYPEKIKGTREMTMKKSAQEKIQVDKTLDDGRVSEWMGTREHKE